MPRFNGPRANQSDRGSRQSARDGGKHRPFELVTRPRDETCQYETNRERENV